MLDWVESDLVLKEKTTNIQASKRPAAIRVMIGTSTYGRSFGIEGVHDPFHRRSSLREKSKANDGGVP